MTDKKDVLEFPLEELEVPQAIALMMQAASECKYVDFVGENVITTDTDNDRLQLLSEKLEAYIEDKLEAVVAIREEPVSEDEPNRYEDAEMSDVFLVIDDAEVRQVVHKGVIFGKLCNATVNRNEDPPTTCCKEWGHNHPDHEDIYGDLR